MPGRTDREVAFTMNRCGLSHKPLYKITYDLGSGRKQELLVCAACYQRDEFKSYVVSMEVYTEEIDG